jgi:hypothetical protein
MVWLRRIDGAVTFSSGMWFWLGQLGLVVLGVHLGADRLDDRLLGWLGRLSVPWPDPEWPMFLATWSAIALELGCVAFATYALLRSRATPALSLGAWARKSSVLSLLAPVFWAPTMLAGCWALSMAVEDLLGPVAPDLAFPASIFVGVAVGLRLGCTGLWRVATRAPAYKGRLRGLPWVAVVLPVTWAAIVDGLPLGLVWP